MSIRRHLLAIALAIAIPGIVLAQSRLSAKAPQAKPIAQSTARKAPTSRPARIDRAVKPASQIVEEPIVEDDSYVDESYTSGVADSCCDSNACGYQWFAGAEYLSWWTNGPSTPALATNSPAGTAQANAGVLGRTGTSVLYGNDSLDSDLRSGGRFRVGGWADACQSHGWEVNYLFLADDSQGFTADANTNSILARPFFNASTGLQDSRLIVFPGLVTGNLGIESQTEFQALEVMFRGCLMQTPCGRTDYLFGYRYANLRDRLRINESTLALSGPLAGTTFDLYDQFDTRNTFHGLEIGVITQQQLSCGWSLDLLAKIAFGANHAHGTISGQRVTTNGLGSDVVPVGLLALGSNIGNYTDNDFSMLPELGVKLNYNLNYRWKASVGYTFLCLTDVVRASDQIDTTINPSQIPPAVFSGVNRPLFPLGGSDFVAQGVSFGLECKF
jgi:hypothetical protein